MAKLEFEDLAADIKALIIDRVGHLMDLSAQLDGVLIHDRSTGPPTSRTFALSTGNSAKSQ